MIWLDLLNPYPFTALLTAVFTLGIGLFVYFRNPHLSINKAFLFFSLAIVQWGICTAAQVVQVNHDDALFWGRLSHVGVLYIPVFFYFFSLKVTTKPAGYFWYLGLFGATSLSIATMATPWFVPAERTDIPGLRYFEVGGPLYWMIIVFFMTYVCLSLSVFFDQIKCSSGPRRKHLSYFFWSSAIGYSVAVVNFFPVYGIVVPPFPYSSGCGAIFSWILAYAILKHQLFDIKIFIKKSVVFTLLFASVYAIVSAVVYFAGFFVFDAAQSWITPFSIAMAMLIYEPLQRLLEHLTNRYLFQKKQRAVSRIQALSRLIEAETLGGKRLLPTKVVDLLMRDGTLLWCAYYIFENDALVHSVSQGKVLPQTFDYDHAATQFVKKRQRPYFLRPLSFEDYEPIEQALRDFNCEAAIPLWGESDIWGVLLLGPKKSDQPYDHEDEAVFLFLQNELSMIFLAESLLSASARSGLEHSQRSKMAALKHLARGVHHEVRNPLHSMSLMASATVDEINKKYAQRLDLGQWRSEVRLRLQSMQEEIARVKDSLGRFAEFARPGEETPKALDLKIQIDKFLALMREGHKLDTINVKQNIEENLNVVATEAMIQESLFSLFINAFDAMNNRGVLTIEAYRQSEFVLLALRDDGVGIEIKNLNKIFEPHFTTKAEGGAAGMGLSIIKSRIEQLGGAITVKSEKGKGAEFTLRFKCP